MNEAHRLFSEMFVTITITIFEAIFKYDFKHSAYSWRKMELPKMKYKVVPTSNF